MSRNDFTLYDMTTEVGSRNELAGGCSCKCAVYYNRHIWGAPRDLQHPWKRTCIPNHSWFWLV